jgi:hypothetical protein
MISNKQIRTSYTIYYAPSAPTVLQQQDFVFEWNFERKQTDIARTICPVINNRQFSTRCHVIDIGSYLTEN